MVSPFLTANDQVALNKEADGSPHDPQSVPLPHIGTDESGKGDYFGPMVIAGVMLEEAARPKLTALGIRDSKKLADGKNRELAAKIRKLCVQRYYEVVLPPERYNSLYTDFKKEGKNLNHMLAWGHARAIESLLGYADCKWAVADQFGNERYIQSRLMKKSSGLTLIQQHKGERFLAVAAASILARDRFLDYMDRLSRTYEITLPKGSSNIVVDIGKQFVAKHGTENLEKVAKLHHKTTEKVL
jgi:ribonuclease HIII